MGAITTNRDGVTIGSKLEHDDSFEEAEVAKPKATICGFTLEKEIGAQKVTIESDTTTVIHINFGHGRSGSCYYYVRSIFLCFKILNLCIYLEKPME